MPKPRNDSAAAMADNEKTAWTKINIAQTVDELIKHGPTIKIGIAPVPFEGSGLLEVRAQIDTGAAGTGMSPRLAKKLNLRPIGTGEIHEAGRERIIARYYRVRLLLPSADIEADVVGLPSLAPPHDLLIGRDVLASCRLIVDFTSGLTGLHIKAS